MPSKTGGKDGDKDIFDCSGPTSITDCLYTSASSSSASGLPVECMLCSQRLVKTADGYTCDPAPDGNIENCLHFKIQSSSLICLVCEPTHVMTPDASSGSTTCDLSG